MYTSFTHYMIQYESSAFGKTDDCAYNNHQENREQCILYIPVPHWNDSSLGFDSWIRTGIHFRLTQKGFSALYLPVSHLYIPPGHHLCPLPTTQMPLLYTRVPTLNDIIHKTSF